VGLITLTKNDPEFESYLLGTFSKDHRAIPVETYHAATPRERVTFRVIPREEVGAPHWLKIYLRSSRPELLGLTMGPAAAVWLNHPHSLQEWSEIPSWLALLGLFFLHTAVFIFNDVQDHIHGLDRLNHRRGSQVIQKGWASAAEMKRWAMVNAGLALVVGLPSLLNAWIPLLIVCLTAAAAILIVIKNFGTRWGLCDLALMAIFGPLITMGIAFASFGESNIQDFCLGFAFGALALWVFQIRQFEDLFRSKPATLRTFLGFLNFDRAHRVVVVEGLILLFIQPAVALVLRLPLIFLALSPLISIPLILTVQRFLKANSPLSSSLVNSSRFALASHFTWAGWWILSLGVTWL
jgi:1,4-dihydroxy-2-naphthoate octaprenyltransferase